VTAKSFSMIDRFYVITFEMKIRITETSQQINKESRAVTEKSSKIQKNLLYLLAKRKKNRVQVLKLINNI